jgi:hypothetical protein
MFASKSACVFGRFVVVVTSLQIVDRMLGALQGSFSMQPLRIIWWETFLAVKSIPVCGVRLVQQGLQFRALLAARHRPRSIPYFEPPALPDLSGSDLQYTPLL